MHPHLLGSGAMLHIQPLCFPKLAILAGADWDATCHVGPSGGKGDQWNDRGDTWRYCQEVAGLSFFFLALEEETCVVIGFQI